MPLLFCFDYLDPISYLVAMELNALSQDHALPPLRRLPLELCPPPDTLLDPDGEAWRSRWGLATAAAATVGHPLTEPALIPWTRKAHELVLHAEESERGDDVHQAIFEAVFVDGRDIGRIDVLVEIARGSGLDATQTKAVLDVDRHSSAVAVLREEAIGAGAEAPPTLIKGSESLRGFHNRDALRTFLLR